jgi:hypothetical protein
MGRAITRSHGLHVPHFVQRHCVIAHDASGLAQLREIASQIVDETVVVVDQQNHGVGSCQLSVVSC